MEEIDPIEAAGREVDVNDPTDMFNGPFSSDGVVEGSIKVIEDQGGGMCFPYIM